MQRGVDGGGHDGRGDGGRIRQDPRWPLPPTHYGSFSESRQPGDGRDRDFVIDGGVLDNIPVGWAVRSVAAAPADRGVDRWLVSLQPVPFRPPERAGTRRPSALETVER